MAAHTSDWGDLGKRVTMVMMFVGGVMLMFNGFLVLFILYNIYRVGGFCSRLNPYRGLAVNSFNTMSSSGFKKLPPVDAILNSGSIAVAVLTFLILSL